MMAADLSGLGERLPGGQPLSQIIVADAEYKPVPGSLPEPLCFTFKELGSGRSTTLWADELTKLTKPPFAIGEDSLFLTFNLGAEYSVMLKLGWELPLLAIDLMVEFRWLTNGREYRLPNGEFAKLYSLVDALRHFGVREVDVNFKEKMQRLAVENKNWTPDLRATLMEYNRQDVDDHEQLFYAMVKHIDFPRAVLRGHYCRAAAKIESRGIPTDIFSLNTFENYKERVLAKLLTTVNEEYGVFEGGRFSNKLFGEYLVRNGLDSRWPVTKTGQPKIDRDTLRDFADAHPQLKKLTSFLSTKKHISHKGVPVGPDGRNRFSMRPFMTKTGRNANRPSECLAACPGWMRNFIKPRQGRVLIQSDWEQQELGIAAALSGDRQMIAAYLSGDPYLALGKQVGAIPQNGTKKTHAAERSLFKQCALGVLFGMGEKELAHRIGDTYKARELIAQHRSTYPTFWEWRQAALDYAFIQGHLDAAYGWRIFVTEHTKATTIGNFPMQANGAEMMRLAVIFAEEQGLEIVAIMHDAFLIECGEAQAEGSASALQQVMRDASRAVLEDFDLRSELRVVRFPDRFGPKDKQDFWNLVRPLLEECATDGT